MATIKLMIQSKKKENTNVNIYIRFSISRSQIFKRKTGFIINPKEWSKKKGEPKDKSDENKNFKSKLDRLKNFVYDAYNQSVNKGEPITGEWLQLQIDLFNNKAPKKELDVLTNYIQKYIDEAPYKQNQKGEAGLSISRTKNIKLFLNTIIKYEFETQKGKSILIKDINLKFVENFKNWLFSKNYSINYVGKNIANIKTICNDANKNDFETSTQIKNIKSLSEKKAPENIIVLSEFEQHKIKNAVLEREALINARKWLLLGCLIGQRGGDLLNITEANIKDLNGTKIIELKQKKTGKLVAVPLLPDALEVIEGGLPYKISLQRFNEYIKDICKVAELNQAYTGRIKDKNNEATEIKTLPKWNFITSHVCRRSFATNFYSKIPTPILMNITAHSTERMFLAYIGKTTYDNAYQMLEYFSKLKPTKNPQLEVIHKNTGTNENNF
jgi:integrase